MVRKAPINPETVQTFRDQALQAVDQTRNQKEFTELAQQSEKLAAISSHPKGREEVGASPSLLKGGKPLVHGIREYGSVYWSQTQGVNGTHPCSPWEAARR